MLTAVQEISHLIEPLASAARAEASQLGHKVPGKAGWPVAASLGSEGCWRLPLPNKHPLMSQVSQMAQYFEPLTLAAVGAASKTLSHPQQMALLDQTKTLAESALQLLYTAKEAGGNPKVPRGWGREGGRDRERPWEGVRQEHQGSHTPPSTPTASSPHPGGPGGGRADDD